ncbi:MAG: hypothetical protein IT379_02995 [Deltaproteobacteria bacterium]|nr:hypothetical protein [Deltaproteobacteria bacterium]
MFVRGRWWIGVKAMLVALAVTACSVTPVPEPPNLDPPDLSKVAFGTSSSGALDLFGSAGALPTGARLWIVNLDRVDPPLEIAAGEDGSFTVNVPAMFGDELRLQAREGDRRSEPVDIEAPSAARVVRPLADCLAVSPQHEVDFGQAAIGEPVEATLRIANACGATVEIASISLRAPQPAFVIGTATPASVVEGASLDIALAFRPERTGLTEEIVLVEVVAPEATRLPVTLWGTTPD